jgi:hypothetical protein
MKKTDFLFRVRKYSNVACLLHVAHAKDMQSARSFEHKLIWSI